MKTTLAVLAVLFLLPAGASAQRIQLDRLDRLADRADEVVNVDIDERMLKIIANLIPGRTQEEQAAKAFILGLRGIFVRRFVFDGPASYTPDDVTTIRKQLTGGNWLKMVTSEKRSEGEVVDVHMWAEGERMTGLGVLVAQRNELTVVNIVGPIDIQRLMDLKGQFGIPDLPKIEAPDPKKP
jgi:hypothetical protein